jgi:hypothetical protein
MQILHIYGWLVEYIGDIILCQIDRSGVGEQYNQCESM